MTTRTSFQRRAYLVRLDQLSLFHRPNRLPSRVRITLQVWVMGAWRPSSARRSERAETCAHGVGAWCMLPRLCRHWDASESRNRFGGWRDCFWNCRITRRPVLTPHSPCLLCRRLIRLSERCDHQVAQALFEVLQLFDNVEWNQHGRKKWRGELLGSQSRSPVQLLMLVHSAPLASSLIVDGVILVLPYKING